MNLADVGTNLASGSRGDEALPNTLDGALVMVTEDVGIHELGLIDDPVDFLVLAIESQEPF
jgi:hypothetical protein